ncbi:MAG TPA: type II toxin-antitoxin system RelE/ParE family toxin [Thermoanaerobaculia bacterium]|nr:type II toxin-antitoxin system RelE/ParE family toxin [Thermoanaerobaculia bacterium]
MRVVLSSQARGDVGSIARHTAQEFGALQKQRYMAGLREHLEILGANPSLGRLLVESSGLRVSHYQRHRVLYRVLADVLEVARVLHDARQAELERVLAREAERQHRDP